MGSLALTWEDSGCLISAQPLLTGVHERVVRLDEGAAVNREEMQFSECQCGELKVNEERPSQSALPSYFNDSRSTNQKPAPHTKETVWRKSNVSCQRAWQSAGKRRRRRKMNPTSLHLVHANISIIIIIHEERNKMDNKRLENTWESMSDILHVKCKFIQANIYQLDIHI